MNWLLLLIKQLLEGKPENKYGVKSELNVKNKDNLKSGGGANGILNLLFLLSLLHNPKVPSNKNYYEKLFKQFKASGAVNNALAAGEGGLTAYQREYNNALQRRANEQAENANDPNYTPGKERWHYKEGFNKNTKWFFQLANFLDKLVGGKGHWKQFPTTDAYRNESALPVANNTPFTT